MKTRRRSRTGYTDDMVILVSGMLPLVMSEIIKGRWERDEFGLRVGYKIRTRYKFNQNGTDTKIYISLQCKVPG